MFSFLGIDKANGIGGQLHTGTNGQTERHDRGQRFVSHFIGLGGLRAQIHGVAIGADRYQNRCSFSDAPHVHCVTAGLDRILQIVVIRLVTLKELHGRCAGNNGDIFRVKNGIAIFRIIYPYKLRQINGNPRTLISTHIRAFYLEIQTDGVTGVTASVLFRIPLSIQRIHVEIRLEIIGHICHDNHGNTGEKQSNC